MDIQDTYGGLTLTTVYTAATALAASATASPAIDVSNYSGNLTGVLTAVSATGDETLFVEWMTCSSATNSAATQLTTRSYFSTVSNTNNGKTQIVSVPVQNVASGWLKPRMTVSAASVYKVNIALLGRKNRID